MENSHIVDVCTVSRFNGDKRCEHCMCYHNSDRSIRVICRSCGADMCVNEFLTTQGYTCVLCECEATATDD